MNTLLIVLLAATLDLQSISGDIDGVTGVAAVHIESGRRIEMNAGERFPMASVYKVPIAIVTLQRVDSGHLKLDQRTRRLLKRAVSQSDNDASDALLALCGGPAAVTAALNAAGIRVDRFEGELLRDLKKHGNAAFGNDVRDTATPNAMAALLVRLWKNEVGLSKRSNDLLLQLMREGSTGPNRIRAGVPAGVKVAHKTGTWPAGANDVAILESPDGRQHIAIAIFTKHGKATTAQREKVIAALTGAIWDELITRAR